MTVWPGAWRQEFRTQIFAHALRKPSSTISGDTSLIENSIPVRFRPSAFVVISVMMSKRRLVGVLAIIGVLLHAGLFIRHNAIMLRAALDHAALADVFSEICVGQANSSGSPDAAHPRNHDGPQSRCLDCLSCASAVALLPATSANHDATYATASDSLIPSDVEGPHSLELWPPGRGPPLGV
jgi:hypothetical protein